MVEAERQLAQMNAIALGSGAAKDSARAVARLEREAGGSRRKKPKTLADLRAAGIPVREVKGGE